MWSSKKSVLLSQIMTYVCAAVLLAAMFAAPTFLDFWYQSRRELIRTILVTFYCCCPFGFAALACLAQLLGNIRKEQIFVQQNVVMLRLLSWLCFAVTVVTVIAGCIYLPFFIAGCAAAFMGMILRVVKNVMSAALEIKNENELTV